MALEKVKIEIAADPAGCGSVFDPVGIRVFTAPCDTTRRVLAGAAIPYKLVDGPAGSGVKVTVNGKAVPVDANFARNVVSEAQAAGYPKPGDPNIIKVAGMMDALTNGRALAIIGLLVVMVLYVTAVYGPIAAALVEFFPTRIRYTAMSLP